MSTDRYPLETLDPDWDNGTMPENVDELASAVIGHKIVKAEKRRVKMDYYTTEALVLTLDNDTEVRLANTNDCCAYTELEAFLLHPDKVDHVIMGVGTTDEYNTWHIYADYGDIMELTVGWSSGNPFYYGYGFAIHVVPVGTVEDES